ncbi:metal-dependent hydrolase [Evansella cellulosilytica]|uniref:Membrane-bound metal-dependent hydrolase n=1 Tax=Evansella cellulosilytica (strain ATCC 21833 / DSM 2522 / FERM P-1141 / JCM 9156 / N-4) TaxID=649639 RepID=E6U1Z5_EVAC2|nr:metal-dependent hydrolase [Evansella cellulosilytica]ADU29239.1 membrane-bound metal-dependent hydrolase [Evansella cellulosilytica DSM 2522]
MDTGTHVVMGVALGGLATLDPIVSGSPTMTQAVMLGAIIGSQAPDFDTVLKLKNNATYLRHHRGVTHSIPAWFIWPTLITIVLTLTIPNVNVLHLWLWTFLAVFLHVFVDIFNAYGTKAFAPIKDKWIALGVINIFDIFIFITHIIGIILWRFGTDPGWTFLAMYAVITCYYIWRVRAQRAVYRYVKSLHPDATHIFTSPTYRWNSWHIVVRTKDEMYVAKMKNGTLEYFETYPFETIPDLQIIKDARKDPNLSAFLSFSPAYRWEVTEESHGYTVKFVDLRYRSKGHYPFIAIVRLNSEHEILSSYTGWIFNNETLKRKLEVAI